MKRISSFGALVLAVLLLAVFSLTTDTLAATATNNLLVQAAVANGCRIKSVANINFGAYDPTVEVTPTDGSGNFVFKCTKNTAYDLYVTGTRQMTSGLNILNYNIYTDAGRTSAWPATSPGVTGTSASNADDTRNIYGRIPAAQDIPAGAYSGTVVITVQY